MQRLRDASRPPALQQTGPGDAGDRDPVGLVAAEDVEGRRILARIEADRPCQPALEPRQKVSTAPRWGVQASPNAPHWRAPSGLPGNSVSGRHLRRQVATKAPHQAISRGSIQATAWSNQPFSRE